MPRGKRIVPEDEVDYRQRLRDASTDAVSFVSHLEDVLSSRPPRNVSGPPDKISHQLSSSFTLHAQPDLVASAWEAFSKYLENHTYEVDPQVHPHIAMSAIKSAGYFGSWREENACTIGSVDSTRNMLLLDLIGCFGLRAEGMWDSHEQPKTKSRPVAHRTATPIVYTYSSTDVRSTPSHKEDVLEFLESPHILRVLYVTDLSAANVIQQLANTGGLVQHSRNRASWKGWLDIKGVDPETTNRARELLVWVYECAYQSNVEFVKLTDGWTSIYFNIDHATMTLHVGRTMIPRCSRPGEPVDYTQPGVDQTFLAICYLALSRKEFSPDRSKLYLPGWKEYQKERKDELLEKTHKHAIEGLPDEGPALKRPRLLRSAVQAKQKPAS